ncbi:MAG: HzsA-related protein [Planctomycetota bacterium]|jgi:hypothetical protein
MTRCAFASVILAVACVPSARAADGWFDALIAKREAGGAAASEARAATPLPDFGTDGFTVTLWIKTRSDGSVFAKTAAEGRWVSGGKSLFISGGRLCYDVGWVGCVEGRARVADGEWHHVALTGGAPQGIYVDGKSDAIGHLERRADVKRSVFKIGWTSTNFPEGKRSFAGEIDDVRVYARALPGEEIAAIAKRRGSDDARGAVSRWTFDNGWEDSGGGLNHAAPVRRVDRAEGVSGEALRLAGSGHLVVKWGEGEAPDAAIWRELGRAFDDEQSRREMAAERADGIWGHDWKTIPLADVAGRYARAARRPSPVAREVDRLAARARSASDLRSVRALYLKSKRHDELLAKLSEFRLKELRGAIAEVHRGGGKADGYLTKLDELEARAASWTDGPPEGAAFDRWKDAVARLRREALLSENPLVGCGKLLFVKRQTFHASHFYTDFTDGVGRYGGNLCVLDLETGEDSDLIPEMKDGIFGRFDLRFGARKVAFDWKRSAKEGFRIYEIDIDPATGKRRGAVRQITFPPKDEAARIKKYDNSFIGGTARMYYHQTDDMHPCYLPDGGIAFVSSRCEYGTLCNGDDSLTTTVMYRVDGDGKNMKKLTNSAVSEFSPSMMQDGRILYTRWEYVDKGQLGIKCLWAMRPDGSGTVEIYGNDIRVPPTFLHGRQIPGEPNLFVFLGTPHYPQSGIGTVIRADMTKNIRTREPMTYITPHVDIKQEPGWNHLINGKWVRHTNGPLYMDPFPLSRDVFLVSHNPDRKWSDPKAYGLYLLTESGAHELVHRDPDTSCWQPMPLKARKAPPALPSMLDPALAKRGLAVCVVQDIYHGMEGVERGEAKYIRVMEQIPRPWDARRFWDQRNRSNSHTRLVSRGTALAAKAMWGVVPVEDDGSSHFYVPADRNIYFQALDKDYMELQRERTYINYMPGETRSCVGCHETPNDTPPQRSRVPLAMKKAPVMPGPQPGDDTGRQAIHYPSYVQPVLDRFCVKCHGGVKPKGRLSLGGELTTHFSRSYENLMKRRAAPTYAEASDWDGSPYSPPKSVGSYKSRLIKALREGKQHADLELPQSAFVRLATWVDASGVYYGSYWGRRHIRYKDHPFFRPVPTFEEAISTVCSVPVAER